jgi:S-adenosylmethionine:tRNA ribosyltransferase-isomerase
MAMVGCEQPTPRAEGKVGRESAANSAIGVIGPAPWRKALRFSALQDDRTVSLNLSSFDFDLPPERIAQTPARPRDSARLLHVGERLGDHRIPDLVRLLQPGDLLVANDTRVIPAQLEARRGEARIGLTLDQPRADGCWHALARNARRLRVGDVLGFDADPALHAAVVEKHAGGSVVLRFDGPFERAGALALPPYIDRPDGPTAEDAADYQTVFARHDGAVAAPTAGLHFTPAVLAALDEAGISRVTVTLHVGAGTFLPVREDDVSRHVMHAERGTISAAAAAAINAARRVVAVGTTSLRLIESAADEDGRVRAFDGDTSLFITPGYRFRRVGALVTNFHLPRSTLFMLTCAFAGTARMRAAYAHAIAQGYRFYSYGDSSLLERA